MLSSSRLEAVACRFDPVVKDLRSFLKDNDVAYGFPEHLLAFTDRLTEDESLRYAISSKLHAMVAELTESTSHGDLVEMLLLTVGGFTIDEDTPPMQQAERVLSRFIGEVMTSPYTLAPGPPPLAPLPAPPAPLTAPPLTLHQTILEPEIQREWAAFPEELTLPETLMEVAAPQPITKPVASSNQFPLTFTLAAFRTLLAPILKPATSSQPFKWTPAPRFVWAALVCGALFPPGMYLISQPHAASPTPLLLDAKAPRPAVDPQPVQPTQAAQPTELDRQTDEDLASIAALGFGSSAGQTRSALSHLRRLRSRQAPKMRHEESDAHSSSTNGAVGVVVVPRETDMPGRDVSSLAPASSASQSR